VGHFAGRALGNAGSARNPATRRRAGHIQGLGHAADRSNAAGERAIAFAPSAAFSAICEVRLYICAGYVDYPVAKRKLAASNQESSQNWRTGGACETAQVSLPTLTDRMVGGVGPRWISKDFSVSFEARFYAARIGLALRKIRGGFS
jgi:hypothetical protein